VTIEIEIDGGKKIASSGLNLAELLDELGVREHILLVELNGEMIRRERFDEEKVQDGDILELIRVAGGG
jgi:sulfur carrier protein